MLIIVRKAIEIGITSADGRRAAPAPNAHSQVHVLLALCALFRIPRTSKAHYNMSNIPQLRRRQTQLRRRQPSIPGIVMKIVQA